MAGDAVDPYEQVGPAVQRSAPEPAPRRRRLLIAGIVAAVAVFVIVPVIGLASYAWEYASSVPYVDDDPMLAVAPAGATRVSSMKGEDLDSPVRFAGVVLRPGAAQSSQELADELADAATAAGWVPVTPTTSAGDVRLGWRCFVLAEDGVPQRVLDIGPYDGEKASGLPGDVALVVSAWGKQWFGEGAGDVPCDTTGVFNGDWYPYPG